MIGHGHIDPTWLWRWMEGYEEVRATFRSALDRMKETPEFIFTASSACFYDWVKSCDPEMFEAIRTRVKEGRWEIAGGWWIEPDCNIPGGESFVRQGLYGLRFFEREFGARVRVGFNPDSFGHAGTFPQLYRKMGIRYYAYQRPEPIKERDYPGGTTFWWQANDGSRILACNLLESYNADTETIERMRRLPFSPHMNTGQTQFLCFFGVGNHGGGPTKKAIADILAARRDGGETVPEFSTLQRYFEAFETSMDAGNIPVATGDLQHHAQGCYTTHAEIKRLNRRAEHELMVAERFATAALRVCEHRYPADAIERAWKDLLYNQFHDILAGSSIESSYEDTRDQIGGARHVARVVTNESIQVIARHIDTTAEGNTLVVFNPLPWPVQTVVVAPPIASRTAEALPIGVETLGVSMHIADADGGVVPSQRVADERIGSHGQAFVAALPAMGYRCYHARSGARDVQAPRQLDADRASLENDWWRVEFDPYAGHISRLFDKKRGVEVLRKGNVLAAMIDPSDTWGHGFAEYRNEAGRFGDASLTLIECGSVRATIRIQSQFGASCADQFVSVYRNLSTIDCKFRINWQERYTTLKLGYETCIANGTATCDVGYGCQVRNTKGTEEPGQKWVDLTGSVGDTRYGLAVMNDCKYGFDVMNDTMRVTLLRSPAYAHHDPSRYDASQPFPIMDQGWHTIHMRLVPHAGDWQGADVARRAWELDEPPIMHIESAHAGSLPSEQSFLGCDAANVLLTVLKKAEDSDAIIVRGYESAGRETQAEVRAFGGAWPVTFAAHEIKTFVLRNDGGGLVEVDLVERPEEG